MYSGGKDKAVKVTDVETSAVKHRVPKAHKSPLYKVQNQAPGLKRLEAAQAAEAAGGNHATYHQSFISCP